MARRSHLGAGFPSILQKGRGDEEIEDRLNGEATRSCLGPDWRVAAGHPGNPAVVESPVSRGSPPRTLLPQGCGHLILTADQCRGAFTEGSGINLAKRCDELQSLQAQNSELVGAIDCRKNGSFSPTILWSHCGMF